MSAYLAILATIVAAAYAWAQVRNARSVSSQRISQDANDTIDILTKRADAFQKQLADANTDYDKRMRDADEKQQINHDEIIRLQEAIKHKDDQIKLYLDIIANRNPELEKILAEVRDFLAKLNDKMIVHTDGANPSTGTSSVVVRSAP